MQRITSILCMLLIGILQTNCGSVTIGYTPNHLEFPVTFSNIPNPTLKTFQRKTSYWFWGKKPVGTHIAIDEMIRREIQTVPGAKGIKNLEIKPYDSVWNQMSVSGGYFVMPYLTGFFMVFANMFGFKNKRVWIYGEIY